MNMTFTKINAQTGHHPEFTAQKITEFLHTHLESFGDEPQAIAACLDYVMKADKGGEIMVGHDAQDILGIVVMNKTGMKDYIPENILVYIAVHQGKRGQGLGKKLMEFAIENTRGAIALHVEAENPARKLYEKLGFTNKYLEMRLNP